MCHNNNNNNKRSTNWAYLSGENARGAAKGKTFDFGLHFNGKLPNLNQIMKQRTFNLWNLHFSEFHNVVLHPSNLYKSVLILVERLRFKNAYISESNINKYREKWWWGWGGSYIGQNDIPKCVDWEKFEQKY